MKLLIVDDHPFVREGLSAVLGGIQAGVVVLQASGAAEGLKIITENPDLSAVLVDITMPEIDGLAALAMFARERPGLPLIVLSGSEELSDMRLALRRGASGYIPKSTPPRAMLAAVQFVLDGNVYVPLSALALAQGEGGTTPQPAAGFDPTTILTQRQLEVLMKICEGRSNKEIATEFDLSDKTVKSHITTIFKALNVVNRMQAANWARRMGLSSAPAADEPPAGA